VKIIAILENEPKSGGGFFQSISAILQMQQLTMDAKLDFEVFTSKSGNKPLLERYGVKTFLFRTALRDKLVALMDVNELTRRIQEKFKFIGSLEKKLIERECKLIYFLGPTARMASIQRLNFIATVWDNCSRDYPEFPEVSNFGEYQRREYIFKNLGRAYLILVDSESLKNKIAVRYQVDVDRVVVMPFSLNPLLSIDKTEKLVEKEVLYNYGIEPGYFFYPAQFWPHKNHIRILQALALLKKTGTRINCIFVGGHQGGSNHVESMIKKYNLSDLVKILGFVDSSHMEYLYKGSVAVIMPTYFGPTNIPPLEAWFYGKPIIYSRHLSVGFEDAVIRCDVDDAESLANAMKDVLNLNTQNNLINNGKKQLKKISELRKEAEKELLNKICIYRNRQSCWE
jgi:glycosyltransferase involved in cell wall biosynthesis